MTAYKHYVSLDLGTFAFICLIDILQLLLLHRYYNIIISAKLVKRDLNINLIYAKLPIPFSALWV